MCLPNFEEEEAQAAIASVGVSGGRASSVYNLAMFSAQLIFLLTCVSRVLYTSSWCIFVPKKS